MSQRSKVGKRTGDVVNKVSNDTPQITAILPIMFRHLLQVFPHQELPEGLALALYSLTHFLRNDLVA